MTERYAWTVEVGRGTAQCFRLLCLKLHSTLAEPQERRVGKSFSESKSNELIRSRYVLKNIQVNHAAIL